MEKKEEEFMLLYRLRLLGFRSSGVFSVLTPIAEKVYSLEMWKKGAVTAAKEDYVTVVDKT